VAIWLSLAPYTKAQDEGWRALIADGRRLEQKSDYPGAAAAYRAALAVAERSGLSISHIAATVNSLAAVESAQGRFSDAERECRRGLAFVEKRGRKESADYGLLLARLADVTLDRGRIARAGEMLQEALDHLSRVLPPDHVRLAELRTSMADVLMREGRPQEAARLLNLSVDVFAKGGEAQRENLAIALSDLGTAKRLQGRRDEALPLLERSLSILEAVHGPDEPTLLRSLNNLAAVQLELGHAKEAEAEFERAVRIAGTRLSPEHPTYGMLLANYAAVLRKTGHKAEAKRLEERAKTAAREHTLIDGAGATVDIAELTKAQPRN
jgi:tetratricopeptide (TPR) repeat protein